MADGIVHIAGPDVQVGDQLRQRCAWCGAVLIDHDLANIAVPEGQDRGIGTWPVGALIEVDGNASWIRDHLDGEPLPASACGQIDHEVTGTDIRALIGDLRRRMAELVQEEYNRTAIVCEHTQLLSFGTLVDAALLAVEEDPVLEIRPYYPTQDAYDAACRALAGHRERADCAQRAATLAHTALEGAETSCRYHGETPPDAPAWHGGCESCQQPTRVREALAAIHALITEEDNRG